MIRLALNVDLIEALAGGMDVELTGSVGDGTEARFVSRGLPLPSWLRDRVRWGASFAVIPVPAPRPWRALAVARLGFFDAKRGDVPIAWTNRWPR